MANEIYHRSNWGNAVNDIAWGDVYEKFDATNEMFVRSDNYENSNETDKLMAAINPKPSILLTPTAYDNGSLHSVKPVKTFGSELVTNGDFATDSDWTLNAAWTISNGKATYDNSASQSCEQSLNFEVGKKYLVNFEISDFTTNYRFDVYTGVSFIQSAIITNQTSYSILFDGDGGNKLRFRGLATGTGFSLDNVSVKEVTEADFDFTRGTIATRIAENGLIEDVTDTDLPRIDYTDGTGSLLLEPQSTNLLTYSEDFSQWTLGSNSTLTYESNVVAPDGSLGVYKLTNPATSSTFIQSPSFSSSNPLTVSLYVKSTGSGNDNFNFYTGASNVSNLKTATSEWQRFDYTADGSSMYIINSGDTFTSDIYIWGAQAEVLSYATSYIPTNGSPVTRSADVCNNAGSSDLINSTEGVLYVEASALANDGTSRRISLNDGTSSNKVNIEYDETANRIRASITSGGSAQTLTYNATNLLQFNKIAVKYKQDDFAIWLNGVEVVTDTSGNAPIGLSELGFNNSGTSLPFYGKVKSVAVYKEALTDAELEKLTTI